MTPDLVFMTTLTFLLLAASAAFLVRRRLPHSRHARRMPNWVRRALERAIPPDPAQQLGRGVLVGIGALIVAQLARYLFGH
jgi:hypothetical protein